MRLQFIAPGDKIKLLEDCTYTEHQYGTNTLGKDTVLEVSAVRLLNKEDAYHHLTFKVLEGPGLATMQAALDVSGKAEMDKIIAAQDDSHYSQWRELKVLDKRKADWSWRTVPLTSGFGAVGPRSMLRFEKGSLEDYETFKTTKEFATISQHRSHYEKLKQDYADSLERGYVNVPWKNHVITVGIEELSCWEVEKI